MVNSPKATQARISGLNEPKVTGALPGIWARVSRSTMRPNRIGSAKAATASATLARDRTAPRRRSEPSWPRTRAYRRTSHIGGFELSKRTTRDARAHGNGKRLGPVPLRIVQDGGAAGTPDQRLAPRVAAAAFQPSPFARTEKPRWVASGAVSRPRDPASSSHCRTKDRTSAAVGAAPQPPQAAARTATERQSV